MNAHIGIVPYPLDQRPKSVLTDGNALVVGIVVAAMNEINRLQMILLLQLELVFEAIERIRLMLENHSVTMPYLFPIAL